MGNGSKAQMKRDRNAKNAKKSADSSQKKVNEAAKTIICSACRTTFLCTVREPALREHATNRHGKTYEECFGGN
ncbi:DUF1909-domain-containing protein [Syncephalis plumigaleata]|nr:DUF1909-domain-containing protein [Syncephalis plumigaleata]